MCTKRPSFFDKLRGKNTWVLKNVGPVEKKKDTPRHDHLFEKTLILRLTIRHCCLLLINVKGYLLSVGTRVRNILISRSTLTLLSFTNKCQRTFKL